MFLKIAAFFTLTLAAVLTLNAPLREKIIGRIKIRLFPPKHVPEEERAVAVLPPEGENTSVETALNSRCCSDNTGNQHWIHWGMFDNETKLSSEQIDRVIRLATIPRFTDHRVEVSADENILTFSIDNHLSTMERDWAMIESGMQQQAVGLVCAALGVGMVFQNLGKDGRELSKDAYGNVRHQLHPMQPSYDGKYWTIAKPSRKRPWQTGNLSDPRRYGDTALVKALKTVPTKHDGKHVVSESAISQLLWAARGRTPHLYKSKPWGMTIPFWTDRIEASTVYLVKENAIYRYENWRDNRPTHSIHKLSELTRPQAKACEKFYQHGTVLLVLNRNDDHARALWEIGYQLLNLLVQAFALDITYEAFLLNEEESQSLLSEVTTDPAAIVAM